MLNSIHTELPASSPPGEFAGTSVAERGETLWERLSLVYYFPMFLLGFALFALGGLFCTALSSLLHLLLPTRLRAAAGQRLIHGLFRFFVTYLSLARLAEIDFREIDKLRDAGPMLLAPNHPCLLDAVFVISRLPRLACVMKAPLLDNPVLGGARLAGYIRNDSPGGLVHGAVEQLRGGRQVLLFPEGTRTVVPPLNPELRGGFAIIAQRAQVPVQLIAIEASSSFLGKTWSPLKLPYFPLRYRATLGPRLQPGTEETSRDFMERTRLSLLEILPPAGPPG